MACGPFTEGPGGTCYRRPRLANASAGVKGVLARDETGVPAPTGFHDATLCLEVDVDNPKALAIALRPLKVIKERPGKIAHDGHIMLNGALYRGDMITEVTDASPIGDASIAVPLVAEGRAIFRDEQRRHMVGPVQFLQNHIETMRVDLPPHLGDDRS